MSAQTTSPWRKTRSVGLGVRIRGVLAEQGERMRLGSRPRRAGTLSIRPFSSRSEMPGRSPSHAIW